MVKKFFAVISLASLFLAGTSIPALAVPSPGPPTYPSPGPPNIDGAIGELTSIAIQLNTMAGRIALPNPGPPNLPNPGPPSYPNPGPPNLDGAIGMLSAMSTELDVISAQVGNILANSAGFGSGFEADPMFVAALGAVTTAAGGVQQAAVNYPSPGPPSGPLFQALNLVAEKSGAIAILSVPNPGPPGLNIGPNLPDI